MNSIQAADGSSYKTLTPAIRGPIPRLARELLIDRVGLLIEAGSHGDIMVSGELMDALALGYDGEIGNFVLRWVCSLSAAAFLDVAC